MSKIATETEARTIGGSGSAETGRMCTKARAIALGCNVASSYADNQLVQYVHLSKNVPEIIDNVIQMQFWSMDINVQFVATFAIDSTIQYTLKTTLWITDNNTYLVYITKVNFMKVKHQYL